MPGLWPIWWTSPRSKSAVEPVRGPRVGVVEVGQRRVDRLQRRGGPRSHREGADARLEHRLADREGVTGGGTGGPYTMLTVRRQPLGPFPEEPAPARS